MDKDTNANDENPKSVPSEASPFMFFCVFAALLGGVSVGLMLGYTSGAASMFDNQSLNKSSAIIKSSATLGALVGALAAGPVSDNFGRKTPMISINILFVAGWLLISFSPKVFAVISGRVLTGLASGFVCGCVPVYIIEVSPTKIRGLIGCSFQTSITVGILLVSILGKFMTNYANVALSCLVPPVLMSCLMVIAPESPVYMFNKVGPSEKMKDSLKRMRKGGDITSELDELQRQPKEKQKIILGRNELKEPSVYKPFLLALALVFFQQCSGINAVIFNQTQILEKAKTPINADTGGVIVNIAQVVATVIGSVLSLRCGRKALLYISAAGMFVGITLLGLFFLMESISGWVAIFSLMLFIVAFSIGFGPIPWMMIPELTPYIARGFVCTISTFLNWTFAFLITQTFDDLQNFIGQTTTFWMFGCVPLLSLPFTKFLLVETSGKSFEEIKMSFLKTRPNSRADLA